MDLKQHIECIKKLEIKKLTLNKTIQSIDNEIEKLGIPIQIQRESNPVSLKISEICPFKLVFFAVSLIAGLLFFRCGLIELFISYHTVVNLSNIGRPAFILSLISFIISLILILIIVRHYRKTVRMFESAEKIIEKSFKIRLNNEQARLDYENEIKKRYQTARKQLYETYVIVCNTLNDLYSKHIGVTDSYLNDIKKSDEFSQKIINDLKQFPFDSENNHNDFEYTLYIKSILAQNHDIVMLYSL